MNALKNEVSLKYQFEFGKNWRQFIKGVNEDQIAVTEKSLQNMLSIRDLKGQSFLDIGSGSGLFSLAAKRLGASVFSFDYDPESVNCTLGLKIKYFPEVTDWTIESGSVLNSDYLKKIGTFDIVYSWGVLHHTGDMWQAFENVSLLVNPGGKLFISIYNDQGKHSIYWRNIKKAYNWLPRSLKFLILWPAFIRLRGPSILRDLLSEQTLKAWKMYKLNRGMSSWHDLVDWVGGYPFEVAHPEEVFEFFRNKGFVLEKLKTCGGGLGCNEFVFKKFPSINKPK